MVEPTVYPEASVVIQKAQVLGFDKSAGVNVGEINNIDAPVFSIL